MLGLDHGHAQHLPKKGDQVGRRPSRARRFESRRPTEDTHFPAYGAQTVHMPFGEVYTSLQTGVVNAAENGVNVYLANKHWRGGAGPHG